MPPSLIPIILIDANPATARWQMPKGRAVTIVKGNGRDCLRGKRVTMSEQEHRETSDGSQEPPPRWGQKRPPAPGGPVPPPPGPGRAFPQGQGFPPVPPNPWAQPQAGANPWNTPQQQGPGWGASNPYGQGGPLPQPGYMPPPKPGIIPLRPLGLGEIMDGAFQACRRSALAAFGSSQLIQGLITVLAGLLGFSMVSSLNDAVLSGTDEDLSTVAGPLTGIAGLGILSVIGVLIVQGLLVVPVMRASLNLKTGFSQMWRIARRRILPLTGRALLLLAGSVVGITALVLLFVLVIEVLGNAGIVVVVLGMLALIAAAAWVSVKLSLAPAALVQEETGVFRSIARSWQLTGRNWWRTFGILLLTSLIVSVLSQVLTVPFSIIIGLASASQSTESAVLSAVLLAAVTIVVSSVGYAFQGAVTALLYVDLRIRREGFDLALMKEQESPQSADQDFLPGRNAPVIARNAPYGPPAPPAF